MMQSPPRDVPLTVMILVIFFWSFVLVPSSQKLRLMCNYCFFASFIPSRGASQYRKLMCGTVHYTTAHILKLAAHARGDNLRMRVPLISGWGLG